MVELVVRVRVARRSWVFSRRVEVGQIYKRVLVGTVFGRMPLHNAKIVRYNAYLHSPWLVHHGNATILPDADNGGFIPAPAAPPQSPSQSACPSAACAGPTAASARSPSAARPSALPARSSAAAARLSIASAGPSAVPGSVSAFAIVIPARPTLQRQTMAASSVSGRAASGNGRMLFDPIPIASSASSRSRQRSRVIEILDSPVYSQENPGQTWIDL